MIQDAIRQMVKSMVKPDVELAKVLEFDSSNWTITIELNSGGQNDQVTIKSVLNDIQTGILVEPEIGSMVLVGIVNGRKENMSVLCYSEIKSIRIIPSETIQLKGDSFGGLVKLQQLETNLNKLKTAIETIVNATASGMSAIGAGSAANGATGATTFNNSTQGIDLSFENMENENVKHG